MISDAARGQEGLHLLRAVHTNACTSRPMTRLEARADGLRPEDNGAL